ncbi:hypothetical protein VFPPC_17732 [Pochonia chlamydosporia 170]|uniref:Uncharacterized protein n=1 Tax=Pochonia chlamydosporia 170 TaxID=1380566 RepID=A0A219AR72_METCM|nr:hypothetical protein VFPPC_17732 [Pochonia chlamydosporia 170]OWT43092.1 hypothetical protein VFPPC_17732 [Pochonia chlamydosporia 170]
MQTLARAYHLHFLPSLPSVALDRSEQNIRIAVWQTIFRGATQLHVCSKSMPPDVQPSHRRSVWSTVA